MGAGREVLGPGRVTLPSEDTRSGFILFFLFPLMTTHSTGFGLPNR